MIRVKMKLTGYVNLWIGPILRIQTQGKKDPRYIDQANGKSKFVPIRYLLWTIRDLLQIINGYSGIIQRLNRQFSYNFR